MPETSEIIEITADIVSAYVGNNSVSAADLPSLIRSIHKAITEACNDRVPEPAAPQAPAVPIRKSIGPEYLICLEDGLQFKSLKRHLRTKFNLSPEEYRAKWGLPRDYPMVAPSYADARSRLAKSIGLGLGGRQAAKAPARSKA